MAIEARLEWSSPVARHVDRMLLRDAALQASGRWAAAAEGLASGGEARLDALPWCQPAGLPVVALPRSHFRLRAEPVPGRFYPRMAFAGLAQGPRDPQPVRLLACDGEGMQVDPNHPLAAHAPELILRRHEAEPAPGVRMADLFQGPGLQQPPVDPERAYLALEGRARQDESGDVLFYQQPRFVHHLDAVCRAEIARLYRRFLRPGMRVLRPGGACVITFSDRWFPSKAIRVWGGLHPFERQAFALSLFPQAGFTGLGTETLRGLARPADDKYAAQRDYADPLFAVWGWA